jgi:hypothetical protein
MKNLNETLTDLVRKILHYRDAGKPCIICGKGEMGKYDVVCHNIKQSKSTQFKWHLHNVALGHSKCNSIEEADPLLSLSHNLNMIERFGADEIISIYEQRNNTVKFAKSDKESLIKELRVTLLCHEAIFKNLK